MSFVATMKHICSNLTTRSINPVAVAEERQMNRILVEPEADAVAATAFVGC